MKTLFFRIFILFLIYVNSVDISSFHVDYFQKNTKLYYVNAMNNAKGNLYLEFWGENDKTRYFIGKNYLTEEPILFNNNQQYFSIQSSDISTFHESLIVNDNENNADNNINILSMNWNTFDFINVENSEFTYKLTKKIAFENEKEKHQSLRNSLIKIKYNDNTMYFSFLIMFKLSAHYLSFTLFELTQNNINGLSVIDSDNGRLRGQSNATSCFQTETGYIICGFVFVEVEPQDFYVKIFEIKKNTRKKTVFEQIGERNLGKIYRIYKRSFFKIFLIKDNIGTYIICDGNDNNIPKVFLKKLNSNFDLENAIENLDFIKPNKEGKYQLDEDLFSADALRISETRFITIFKIKDTFNMLLCVFDFNKNYTGIIVRYYVLNFAERNINIAVNIRCFVFKESFGIIFYDSYAQYPGYMFFNHINIISKNRIDFRTIRINLSDSSLTTFSFSNSIRIENNLFDGDINIKIISLPSTSDTLIKIKKSNSDILITTNYILSIDDSIIIDTSCSLIGDYTIEFLPFSQEINVEKETYGNYQEAAGSDQYAYYTKDNFKLIFSINSCSSEQYTYVKSQDEIYCLSSCSSYNKATLYQDEDEKKCYSECSVENNNKIFIFENKCMSQCPSGYSPDENNICILNEPTTININVAEVPFVSTYIDKNINIPTTEKNIVIESTSKVNDLVETSIIENNQNENPIIESTLIKYTSQMISLPESTLITINLEDTPLVETSSLKEDDLPKSSIIENQLIQSTLPRIISTETNLNENSLSESSTTNNINIPKETSIPVNTLTENIPSQTNIIPKTEMQSTIIDNILLERTNPISQGLEQTFSFNSQSNDLQDNIMESSIKYTDKALNINKCGIDINSLISDYKSNDDILEYKDLEGCSTTYYCYLSNEEIDALINVNPKLTYINIQDCKNELINNNILNENSELLVVSKKDYNGNSHYFELYDISGNNYNKIDDISVCNTKKIETVSSIENTETLEKAIALFEQGYDIFNLSSSFYNDICISVNINNSDVTLSIRQKDIKPDESSLCSDGCVYNGVNLTTRRIKCLCDMDENKNKTTNTIEEVEEKFFSYILDMINYKIIKCYLLVKNLQKYYNNYGFYIAGGIFLIIIILFFAYLCHGNKSIKIKYLRNEPKTEENQFAISNNIYDIVSSKRDLISYKKGISILSKDTDDKNVNRNKKNKSQRKSKGTNKYSEPPKKRKSINNKSTNDDNKKKKHRKSHNFKNIKIEICVKDSPKLLNRRSTKFEEIMLNSKKNINPTKNEDNEEENNNIDYNELTYQQALLKDKRNIIHMYFSNFLYKLDIVQIFCFASEFSHLSVTLSLYLFELLLDLTLNAFLFSDEVISQKYYNNGSLLLITSNLLSLASNIISSFIVFITSYLVKYEILLEAAVKETKNMEKFYQIFIRIYSIIKRKILIFYFLVFLTGLFCTYYLFIFCAIYQKAQENLFINYIIGLAWGLGYKVAFSLVNTILRKISLVGKCRRLYIITRYISDKF